MVALKYDRFEGLLPRTPAALLPDRAATVAENCDFAYGELRSVRDGFLTLNLVNAAASLYTEDGLSFFSWPDDVDAVRSPLANDQFNRLYFTTPTDFRVATRAGMSLQGGVPGSSYRVGVPRPAIAPVLAIPEAPPLDTAVLTATFHYEASGTKYLEQEIGLITVKDFQEWTFTPPIKPGPPAVAVPDYAFPVLRLVAKDLATDTVVLDAYTSNSSLLSANATYTLSLTKNDTGDSYTVKLEQLADESNMRSRAYVYTYVNTYNEEGPASPPATITLLPKFGCIVQATLDANTGGYAPIKEIRIYHSPDDSDVADYFYAGSIPVLGAGAGPVSWTDTVDAASLNETLTSENSYPPDPAMVGLTELPNGILMGWKGNELHFSDAYRPWSWPPAYRKTFGMHQVIGAVPAGSGALVTTTGPAFLVSGVSPDAMTESQLPIEQAGVSKWSIANVGDSIIYASHDGLVTVMGMEGSMSASERFFTRDVWRQRCGTGLSSMRFSAWDGRLIVYSSTGKFVPFVISLDEAAGAMTDLPAFTASCSFVSPLTDQCYYMQGKALYQFAGGADLPVRWKSKEIVLSSPTNFGCMQAVCTGAWRVEVYAQLKDAASGALRFELVHTENLTGTAAFRLPGHFTSDRWMVQISGSGRFQELRAARTFAELKKL